MPLAGNQWRKRDVAKLCWDARWTNADNLMIMVAIIGAESAYFDEAWNFNPPTTEHPKGTYDWGMFMLNDGGLQGAQQDTFKNNAFDPTIAVESARSLYDQRKFQPWVAYGNGSYKKFIPGGCVAVCNMLAELHGLPAIV